MLNANRRPFSPLGGRGGGRRVKAAEAKLPLRPDAFPIGDTQRRSAKGRHVDQARRTAQVILISISSSGLRVILNRKEQRSNGEPLTEPSKYVGGPPSILSGTAPVLVATVYQNSELVMTFSGPAFPITAPRTTAFKAGEHSNSANVPVVGVRAIPGLCGEIPTTPS